MTPKQIKKPENSLKKEFESADAHARHEIERFRAELRFAGGLCDIMEKRAPQWRRLIAKANETVEKAAKNGGVARIRRAVREAEKVLGPIGKAAKKYTAYCVGHAHVDMNWMWSWPETAAITNDSFTTVLRLMDEFPDFRFSQSQASVYEIMEKYRPDLLERIAERVREGRWEVTASHWVEGDKNLAGAESLCRHLLYTRRYMQKLFGLGPEDVPIDWSPDTFGHAATVPTYLVRGGVKYLYLHRPGANGPERPEVFWWRGPDGSRVLARNDMKLGYNGQITPEIGDHLLRFNRETGLPFFMFVYGVGDHGGGPTRRDILLARDMNEWPVFPNVVFSTAREYFERLEKEGDSLPTLDCELNMEFTGCYTSESLIKKSNRFAENRLADAETAASIAWAALGADYPAAHFEEGWRDTLFSHFHDILPGSGVHDTRTYCHGLYQKTVAMTGLEETKALRLLASKIDTSSAGPLADEKQPPSRLPTSMGSGAGYGAAEGDPSCADQSSGSGDRPFVVFNPTAWERNEVVETTVWDNAWGWRTDELDKVRFSVRTPDGETIPAQTVGSGQYWAHDYVRVAFPVRVPSLGYALYTIAEEEDAEEINNPKETKSADVQEPAVRHLGIEHHCFYTFYERGPEGLENEFVRMEVDMKTGGIRSLVDKRSGVQIIAPAAPAPVLEFAVERPHNMTAWTIQHTGPAEPVEVLAIDRKQKGPHKVSIDVKTRVHESDFTITYEVRAGDPNLYIHVEGTWFERGTPEKGVPVLRLAFPMALQDIQTRYEIPFGSVDRDMAHGEEVPALQWAQVSGLAGRKRAGCLLLNDSKHGHSLDGNTLRLTLIRSSCDPDPLPEIGRHEIHVALRPFAGTMPEAEAIRIGGAFNHAPRVIGADVHEGALPPRAELVSVTPKSIIMSAVKKSEDGRALLLRFFDPTGKAATAKAKLNAEILGKPARAVEVDLLERPVADSTAKVKGDAVHVDVPARGVASVLVELEK